MSLADYTKYIWLVPIFLIAYGVAYGANTLAHKPTTVSVPETAIVQIVPTPVTKPTGVIGPEAPRHTLLPKPVHRIPVYPKEYCDAIRFQDKSYVYDQAIMYRGWSKTQVDQLYRQCKI